MYKILVTCKTSFGVAMQVIEFDNIDQARRAAEKINAQREHYVTILWS